MLWTGLFALAASDAVAGLAMLQRDVVIVHVLAGKAACGARCIVVQSEILRNGDVPGAAMGAIGAAGTRDWRVFFDDLDDLFDDLLLCNSDRFKTQESVRVVFHLFHTVHAGEHPA